MSTVIQVNQLTAIPTFWRARLANGTAVSASISESVDLRIGYVRVNTDWTTTRVAGANPRNAGSSGLGTAPSDWQWIPFAISGISSLYRLDVPAAAWAAGARMLLLYVEDPSGATVFERLDVDLLVSDDVSAARPSDAQIADRFVGRNIKGSTDGGRTIGQALAAVRNRVVRSGTTLTVYDTDDTTVLWTAVVTGFAGNVEMDPVT
jgi:hypothetical protein